MARAVRLEYILTSSLLQQPSVLNRALSPPHEVPEFTVTSYGVRARLPVIQICEDDTSIAVAVLACQGPGGSIIGLLLHQQAHPDDMPLYRIGVHCMYHDIGRPYPLYGSARYVRIHLGAHSHSSPAAETAASARFALSWREVFLVYHAHSFGFADLRGALTSVAARPLLAPCRLLFPQWMLARLAARGFAPARPLPSGTLALTTAAAFEVAFTHGATGHAFTVRFACCMRPGPVVPDGSVDTGSPRVHAHAHKHTPFRPLWAVVDASWPPRHPSSHRDSPTAYSGVQQGVARRCVWCRETHIDYWPELEAQAGGRAGRAMEFHFVGRTVRVTISHWDARSRAHEAEGSGGGLYAVNIEVEDGDADGDGEEGESVRDTESSVQHGVQQERVPRPVKSLETASRRSSSRPNSIRSLIAAVHRQVLGSSKGTISIVRAEKTAILMSPLFGLSEKLTRRKWSPHLFTRSGVASDIAQILPQHPRHSPLLWPDSSPPSSPCVDQSLLWRAIQPVER